MLTKEQAYNRERKAQSDWAKRDLIVDEMLVAMYRESIAEITNKIDHYYIAYAGYEGISPQEAQKILKGFDVTAWAQKAAKAVAERDFSPHTNAWLKKYNAKMRISRAELMRAELDIALQSLFSQENALIDQDGRMVAMEEYRRQAGILGAGAEGVPERIQDIVNADFYGETFSERIWGRNGQYESLRKSLFASISRMNVDMSGYREERRRLMQQFQVSQNEAMRLLRTERARIRADADLRAFEDFGATHYIYVAEPGACSVCASLDEKIFEMDEAEKGLNFFPMHPSCRCSVIGHMELKYKDGRSTLDEWR